MKGNHKVVTQLKRQITIFFLASFCLCFFTAPVPASTISYSYDAFGRLKETDTPRTGIIHTYDNIGNRLTLAVETVTSEQYLAAVITILKIAAGIDVAPATVTDVNGDGKIGLAEALYGLQVAAGVR